MSDSSLLVVQKGRVATDSESVGGFFVGTGTETVARGVCFGVSGGKPWLEDLGGILQDVSADQTQALLPRFNVSLHFSLKRWDDFHLQVPKKENVVEIPYFGWDGKVWYDGPIIHWVNSQIHTYVPRGFPARLTLDLNKSESGLSVSENMEVVAGFIEGDGHRLLEVKNSLLSAIRNLDQYENKNRNILVVDEFTQADALVLCLFRSALPRAYLEISQLPADKNRAPVWKRLCQNLGIVCGRAQKSRAEISSYEVGTISTKIPKELISLLRDEINLFSATIPPKI